MASGWKNRSKTSAVGSIESFRHPVGSVAGSGLLRLKGGSVGFSLSLTHPVGLL